MYKEIGSNFYISSKDVELLSKESPLTEPIFKDNIFKNISFLSSCRGAISLCLQKISCDKRVALTPSFTCESVLSPFVENGYKVYPYKVNLDLEVDWDDIFCKIKKIEPSVIIFHPYFGFDLKTIKSKLKVIKDLGIHIIDDMTQSMFSGDSLESADFHIGSIRKWLQIPDGAFINLECDFKEEDLILSDTKYQAMFHKGQWIEFGIGDKNKFRKELAEAENILSSQSKIYSISTLSKRIINLTDFNELIKIRRMNYNYLLNGFISFEDYIDIPFKRLDDNVCPFNFPVFVKNDRDKLQKYMASKSIYPTVIWSIPKSYENKVDVNTKYIYDHILCFHIDQRYNLEDMERILSELRNFYNYGK